MMGLDERVFYLLIGFLIGLFVGYVTRSLRDINEKVTEELEIIKHEHDERGRARIPSISELVERTTIQGLALFFVVALTAYSAIVSQVNSNEVKAQAEINTRNTQNIGAIALCTSNYLSDLLVVVNARTTYTTELAEANVLLQDAQSVFVGEALIEPALEAQRVTAALRDFQEALDVFQEVSERSIRTQKNNKYPEDADYQECLAGEMSPK